MAYFKLKHVLRSVENGWEEDWYVNAGDIAAALTIGTSLAVPRSFLCGTFTAITAVKVFDLETERVSSISTRPQADVDPNAVVQDEVTNTAWGAINVRLDAGTQYHRTWAIRGVDDSYVRYSVANEPVWDPNFLNALLAWQIAVTTAPNQLYVKVLSKEPGINPGKSVTGVAGNVGANRVTITAPGHGFVLGDVVRIKKIDGKNLRQVYPGRLQVNGKWEVMAPTANTFDIGLPLNTMTGSPTWTTGGLVFGTVAYYAPIIQATPMAFMRRKAGAFRDLPNARSKQRRPNY